MDFIKEALTLGFDNAAVIDVKDLVFVLEYRHFCEENLCGNFNVLSSCPPDFSQFGNMGDMENMPGGGNMGGGNGSPMER